MGEIRSTFWQRFLVVYFGFIPCFELTVLKHKTSVFIFGSGYCGFVGRRIINSCWSSRAIVTVKCLIRVVCSALLLLKHSYLSTPHVDFFYGKRLW